MTEEGFIHARAGQVVQILTRQQERMVRTEPGWPPQQGPVGKKEEDRREGGKGGDGGKGS